MTYAFDLTDGQWQAKLSKEQFRVLREKSTEQKGTGIYNKHFEKGVYSCAACDAPLYTSETKFDSGCGWPAFFDAIPGAIKAVPDADGFRMEIVCAQCNGHMGHIFKNEGHKTPTNERHCVNSVSLNFKPQVDESHLHQTTESPPPATPSGEKEPSTPLSKSPSSTCNVQ
ncbi:Aste57867_23189 [Aphanomyces stellatus]|uniref:Peptide-methionine (R)-S-oxide reductase n=1 Tax=Aphanomyces stellatus TaxID=120398 RepID=A0A485LMW8_9STRA|nr:hypothetical protein As57867_023118 [Aphanomyces stellatus]VFT99836.1 Aste57867_23189 [Aphanomyces stellatus]